MPKSSFGNSLQDLSECIDVLLECDAFELQMHIDENGQTDYYLPYMMNDALECYFILKDCKMTGDYTANSSDDSITDNSSWVNSDDFGNFAHNKKFEVQLVENASSPALIIHQANGNVATLWFRDLEKVLNCFRYHEIGHFWVKGQEQWRQLVYIIGTIYDKFEYMGTSICNEAELALLPLMEFAPFRYWSPIHESLDGRYPDTLDGIEYFKNLCKEAEDWKLLKLTERYKKLVCDTSIFTRLFGKYILPRLLDTLANELTKSGHETLYELIYKKVCNASSKYPARDYGKSVNELIETKRYEITDALISKGFSGEYPRFHKDTTSVLVTEEHPFTLSVLEYENYGFRLQLMVSETPKSAAFLNQGFFEGNGNHGWVAKDINEL